MPLVIITGLPSVGKSTLANRLVEVLEQKIAVAAQNSTTGGGLRVVLHSDESLGISHADYRESATEKAARGAQMSAVKRDLGRNTVVVLDSLCYIKGFRYQLFCEAKLLSTPHCVVHLMAPLDVCLERNAARPQRDQWDPELIRQVAMRYEEPDNRSRWDSPLVPVLFDDEDIPVDDVWQALVHPARKLRPNNATVLKQANTSNFLQELDTRTQQVLAKVAEFQQLHGSAAAGGVVVVEKGNREDGVRDLAVELPLKVVSNAQLQRIRRTYIGLNRVRAVEADRIIPLFVEYLNNSLNNDEM